MDAFSRRIILLGGLGLAGAAVTGCSPAAVDVPTPAPPATTPAETPTTAPVDDTPRWPLTGRPLKQPADAQKVAVLVKVPDNVNEHPQLGLQDADIIFVELEGYPAVVGQSTTRLAPVFHTTYPDGVNPVRSIRPVDIALFSPITGIIGSTGGAAGVKSYAAEFDDYLISERDYQHSKGTGSYGILAGRIRTLGGKRYFDRAVLCHPAALAKLGTKFAKGPQQQYFPWAANAGEVSTAVSGKPAKKVVVPWKSGNTYTMTYDYDSASKRYLRSEPWGPHVYAGGIRAACDNVLVIRATQVFGMIDVEGNVKTSGVHPEPVHEIVNRTGSFFYANRGKYVRGTWTKGAVNEVFQFPLDDGTPLKMAPGQTYVELPNLNTKITITG